MKNVRIALSIATLCTLLFAACSNPSGGEPLSSPKAITGFTVAGVAGDINAETKTVTVTVPQGTALTGLAPEITIDGASVSPLSGTAQNFFTTAGYSPVVYTVTAADGSNAYWTVTVKWAPLASDGIEDYLASPPTGATGGVSGGPVILPVNTDLSGNGWADLLDAINDASSVSAVALDLSACTGGGAEFDPDNTNSTGKDKIVSLILPDAATSIKAGNSSNPTFKNFSALKSIVGGAVTSIGQYAFCDCNTLEAMSLPAATTIGEWAFFDCDVLETISLPAATTIGEAAFLQCGVLTTVNLPAATTIGGGAFTNCDTLETVSLPAVTSIGDAAFDNCTALTTISLPASLVNIGFNPFTECINLTTITIAAANPKYKVEGGNLLTKDDTTLVGCFTVSESVNLPGITTINGGAFYGYNGYSSLTSVNFPNATTIGPSAFRDCTNLTTVDLPKAVTIGEIAFSRCTALETVNLPAVTSIGGWAVFHGTGTTKTLTVTLGDTPPELGTGMFYYVPPSSESDTKSVTVKVPDNTAWSSIIGTYSGSDTTPNWGNAFRGGGWESGSMGTGTVNENISLTIEALP
jgi:hypothetical protein